MTLPRHFCWTRYGTEAGETIDEILERKERERAGNGGVFLWGIGNAIGPSMRELLKIEHFPEVIFSPIRSKPKRDDTHPATVIAWGGGRNLHGLPWRIPEWSIVTSRASSGARPRRHYALVCYSDAPLGITPAPPALAFDGLRNLLSGNGIGASQVTAVVCYQDTAHGRLYPATIRARLVAPYLVELCSPQVISGKASRRPAVPERMSVSSDGGELSLFNLDS